MRAGALMLEIARALNTAYGVSDETASNFERFAEHGTNCLQIIDDIIPIRESGEIERLRQIMGKNRYQHSGGRIG